MTIHEIKRFCGGIVEELECRLGSEFNNHILTLEEIDFYRKIYFRLNSGDTEAALKEMDTPNHILKVRRHFHKLEGMLREYKNTCSI